MKRIAFQSFRDPSKAHRTGQDREAGEAWQANNPVFCHADGDAYTPDALSSAVAALAAFRPRRNRSRLLFGRLHHHALDT
jgi:hypothetical protein